MPGQFPNGITLEKAEALFDSDLAYALKDAQNLCINFDALSDNRKAALLDMSFNLGRTKLKGFKRFLEAIEAGRWGTAKREMLNSKWANQVGRRAIANAELIAIG